MPALRTGRRTAAAPLRRGSGRDDLRTGPHPRTGPRADQRGELVDAGPPGRAWRPSGTLPLAASARSGSVTRRVRCSVTPCSPPPTTRRRGRPRVRAPHRRSPIPGNGQPRHSGGERAEDRTGATVVDDGRAVGQCPVDRDPVDGIDVGRQRLTQGAAVGLIRMTSAATDAAAAITAGGCSPGPATVLRVTRIRGRSDGLDVQSGN